MIGAIRPAPIVTLPAHVPATRVVHWFDEGVESFGIEPAWTVTVEREGSPDSSWELCAGDWT